MSSCIYTKKQHDMNNIACFLLCFFKIIFKSRLQPTAQYTIRLRSDFGNFAVAFDMNVQTCKY